MKIRRGIAAIMAVAVMAVVGCQKEPSYSSSGSSGSSSASPGASASPAGPAVPPSISAAPVTATPPEIAKGESLFKVHCGPCHGLDAMGTDHGPPLIHPIYQPAHHSDASFYLAIRNGSRAHHWMFGDMPPVQGVSDDDSTRIVAYIRWIQHRAGIF